MPDLADMEVYCSEARALIARAEEAVRRLEQNGACEGHRLMALQGLSALRHLQRGLELHRARRGLEAQLDAGSQTAVPRRNWLSVVRQRLSIGGAALEVRT